MNKLDLFLLQVSQLAYEIIAGKEISCVATRVEISNDDRKIFATFSKILGSDSFFEFFEGDSDPSRKNIPENEDAQCLFDAVYLINFDGSIDTISQKKPPSRNLLKSERILLFDFFTEIYIWIGRNSDRALIKFATEKANILVSV